jgi:hypothetical protein
LVGLPACNGGGVRAGIFGIWLCSIECVVDGLRILCGDTRAQGVDFSFATFGKTMPFFGNILPTLRSYSGIENPPWQRLRLIFTFVAERPGSGLRADAATSRVLTRDRRQGRRAAGGGRCRGRAIGAVNPISRCAQVVIKPEEVAKFQKKYVSLFSLARCAR